MTNEDYIIIREKKFKDGKIVIEGLLETYTRMILDLFQMLQENHNL